MLKNELQNKLTKIDSHLSCEIITKDNTKANLNGTFLELQQQSAGDVIVKYDGEIVLSMIEVEGTPAIKLEGGYLDKPNSKMFANLIELCGSYLPDDDE
ncbi:hypothetical protein LfeInf_028 [Lactobacillus phage LfeInf]|uniref:Uncharacterized protein n=1 Tax=Lactobacillus phage LfeInf TaxID=1567484 RepID=A0A0A7NNY7_9CAUD|nr:hypothetical protein AXJ15_gp028 [Lactobacillus phage LfeInf]AIZ94654.1 hypothetical protein LfeInf_028 [Lactobacillus phage LfeInf]